MVVTKSSLRNLAAADKNPPESQENPSQGSFPVNRKLRLSARHEGLRRTALERRWHMDHRLYD